MNLDIPEQVLEYVVVPVLVLALILHLIAILIVDFATNRFCKYLYIF